MAGVIGAVLASIVGSVRSKQGWTGRRRVVENLCDCRHGLGRGGTPARGRVVEGILRDGIFEHSKLVSNKTDDEGREREELRMYAEKSSSERQSLHKQCQSTSLTPAVG